MYVDTVMPSTAVAVPGRAHQGGKHERAFMNARSAPGHACLFYTTLEKTYSRDASVGGVVRENNNKNKLDT